MEALTRLVADFLARHGLDRPVDPRRLQWSRWFHCDSPHSLLVVPSKPGIFALAEEIMEIGPTSRGPSAPSVALADSGLARFSGGEPTPQARCSSPEGAAFISPGRKSGVGSGVGTESQGNATNSDATAPRRMLAVLQFSEDDDMAFTLDRMFTRTNPMRDRLASGRCFLRFVVIEDQAQRRSICATLNQWMLSSAEKATGIGADFQSSLELSDVGTLRVGRALLSDSADSAPPSAQAPQSSRETDVVSPVPYLDSGANKNLHCPHPLPSGF
jgi:hypothetical protein